MRLGQRPSQSPKAKMGLVSRAFPALRRQPCLAHLRGAAFASSARSRSLHGRLSTTVTVWRAESIGRLVQTRPMLCEPTKDESEQGRPCPHDHKAEAAHSPVWQGQSRTATVEPRQAAERTSAAAACGSTGAADADAAGGTSLRVVYLATESESRPISARMREWKTNQQYKH